jgi:hypothetical protein
MAGLAECQFNTNCWIRGRMVAMTGDFSGTFSAEIVEVANAVNIRNGAVSTYTQISRTAPTARKESLKTMEFVVTQQPYDAVIDITIPITMRHEYYDGQYSPRIRWSRNGIVIREDYLNDYGRAMIFFNSIRLLDFNVPANTTVTYKVELIDYYKYLVSNDGNGNLVIEYGSGGVSPYFVGERYYHDYKIYEYINPYFMMWFKGKALIGIRKR